LESQESGVPVVILAGGKAKPELQALTGQESRALVVVNGKTLLRHIVDAALAVAPQGKIVVVGEMPDSADYSLLPDQGDFVSNVFAGVGAFADAPFVLIATSDLPFIEGSHVREFVQAAMAKAEESGAGLVWSVVPVAKCYARFPNVKRTALKLKEGGLTGGNLMLARPSALLPLKSHIAGAYAARKSPLRLALMLGGTALARLLVSQTVAPNALTIPLLEAQVSRLLGTTARAVVSNAVEIATDLDRPSDFAAVGLTL
jgi:GTP:adenosylcobinamide-phosphate guanylyltransferase